MASTALVRLPHRSEVRRRDDGRNGAVDELANLDAWVQSVFEPTTDEYGNLVSGSTPAGFDLSGGESILRRITAVFSDPCRYLDRYSDSQLGDGLRQLWHPGEGDTGYAFGDASIPWSTRRLAIDSIGVLFERLLARRCARTYAEWSAGPGGSLDHLCFMWWDVGFPNPFDTPADEAVAWVSVQRRILGLDSVACQLSALHGLGEMGWCWSHITAPIIEEFLDGKSCSCPELRAYAQAALAGNV